MEYNFNEESVNALLTWAKNTEMPQAIKLTEHENILDVPKYILSNVYDINSHYPDPRYNAAITRLYRLKEYLK
ncbi:DUF6965 family protein [uncultured Bacteroides sp.]|uniref:DUF6965 family protein n=1 Tax=uncultured Bacteroides sp. TaxID=162156 RepID=UPI002AA79590|nr:hypothetical protein [uncultured Bacteroides sp.]